MANIIVSLYQGRKTALRIIILLIPHIVPIETMLTGVFTSNPLCWSSTTAADMELLLINMEKQYKHTTNAKAQKKEECYSILLLLLYEIVHEVHKKKEGRKKLNYGVQTYSISATISNGQKSDGSRST